MIETLKVPEGWGCVCGGHEDAPLRADGVKLTHGPSTVLWVYMCNKALFPMSCSQLITGHNRDTNTGPPGAPLAGRFGSRAPQCPGWRFFPRSSFVSLLLHRNQTYITLWLLVPASSLLPPSPFSLISICPNKCLVCLILSYHLLFQGLELTQYWKEKSRNRVQIIAQRSSGKFPLGAITVNTELFKPVP